MLLASFTKKRMRMKPLDSILEQQLPHLFFGWPTESNTADNEIKTRASGTGECLQKMEDMQKHAKRG